MKQLNKIFTIVSVLLILLLAASLLYTDKVILKPKPPERLNKIPKQAVWVGGVDGG